MVKQHNQLMISLLVAGDLVSLAAAWAVAYGLRALAGRHGITPYDLPGPHALLLPVLVSLLLALVVFTQFGLYQPKRLKHLLGELFELTKAVVVVWLLTYALVNFARAVPISRILMASLLVSWLLIAVAGRVSVRSLLRAFRRRGFNLRTAAIVGTGRLGQKLAQALEANTWTGIEVRYFLDIEPASNGNGHELLGRPVQAGLDRLDAAVRGRPVDMVLIALPTEQFARLDEVLEQLATCNVDIRVIPDLLAFHFLQHEVSQLDNLPIIALSYNPQAGWGAVFKRLFDLAFSAVALAALAVPMLAIAVAIKLASKGPVFYTQERASIDGRPFRLIKFRTMDTNAEAGGPQMTARDDPRVTGVGRLLRRTSMDELPQLFNVLMGKMSLVGPRPERPEFIERFREEIPRYMFRHQVKAGLTGWAQVNGLRGDTSIRKRIQYDLYYISNWSFGFDLRIIVMTLFRGLANPNAY